MVEEVLGKGRRWVLCIRETQGCHGVEDSTTDMDDTK